MNSASISVEPSPGRARHERSRRRPRHRHKRPRWQAAFVPLLVGALAFLAWACVELAFVLAERARLSERLEGQEPQVAKAALVIANVNGLEAGWARLAEQGDAEVAQRLADLRRRRAAIEEEDGAGGS